MDYVARQKVQSTHLNFYILKQLPIVPPNDYARNFGPKTAEQIIREDVLHLTYVSHDMKPFAADQGYVGPPFPGRRRPKAPPCPARRTVLPPLRLDRDAADYVLGTFPIVQREERARYDGRFRSRDLILGYMAALAAGHPDAGVEG